MADEIRVTQAQHELEFEGEQQYVTQVFFELEFIASEERTTQTQIEAEFANFDLAVTSDVQMAEYHGGDDSGDIIVTSVEQSTEWVQNDLRITSLMQMVEYLNQPPPQPPPGVETCPPFRIFWQDSVVYVRSWNDSGEVQYHEVRPFGGHHQVDGAKI